MTAAGLPAGDPLVQATGDRPPTSAPAPAPAGDLHPALIVGLDWLAQHPTVERLRAFALAAIRLDLGMTVLDVGCGTGELLRMLGDVVGPGGRTVGLDRSHSMVSEARRRALTRTAFLAADARRLPLPDGSVEAVWCERVLQHLSEPRSAVTEMARVLRPGGRMAVIDTDWAGMTIFPGDPNVTRRVVDCWTNRTPSGRAGRQLPDLLGDAGLTGVSVTGEILTSRDSAAPAIPPFIIFVQAAVRGGCIASEQARDWLRELLEAGRRGAFRWSVPMYAAAGTKSAGA